METWIVAMALAGRNLEAWVLDLIEGTWKKATVPKDE
jgi:hypothetical protein